MNKCIGCGITLQNTDPQKLGYTKKLDNLYCERCFKTKYYNEEKVINNLDNQEIIQKINKLNLMTIFITDLLSINTSLINVYKEIKNPKVLVINKSDLIPNNLKLEHLKENMQNCWHIKEDILFISAKKMLNLEAINKVIMDNRQVIFCGETSSGKSTLINTLIGSNLTTSKFNNTTLDFIKLKYLDNLIYDTPGILINPQKENIANIDIKTIKLNPDYTYNIGDLKIQGSGNITAFLPNKMVITSRKENLKEEFKKEFINTDIELLNGGFIYLKDKVIIKSNQELNYRKSIISK